MSRKAIIAGIVIAVAIIAIVAAYLATQYKKAPVTQKVTKVKYGPRLNYLEYRFEDEDKAIRDLALGKADAIIDIIAKPENVRFAEQNPNIKLYFSICGLYDLLVNPVPCKNQFNPFSIPEVRLALQYAFNRKYIADEILQGLAVPVVTHKWPGYPDYERLKPFMEKLQQEYSYNFTKAWKLVYDALTKHGCKLVHGKWYCNGKPVVVKIFIRVEDYRRQIGDYVASVLEKLGFTVQKIYRTGKEAIPIVYSGDPRTCQWNIYTEGWVWTSMEAYPDSDYEFFCCDPASGSIFLYYKPPKKLVELADKLAAGNYTSLEQRNELIKQILELDLKQAVRIWLIARKCPFAVYKDLIIPESTFDVVAGLWSPLAFRVAHLKGEPVGGKAVLLETRQMFVSAWNPIGGETWIYDIEITQYLWDPGLITHPKTGEYIPYRIVYKVYTAGPHGKLPIPAGTIIWDPKARMWKPTPYKYAKSKVVVRFIFGKWHDNTTMNMADVLAWLALQLDIATNGTPVYDPNIVGPTLMTFKKIFRGIRIVNSDAVELYLDYWHPDKSMIARYASILWPVLPYHLVALIYKAVADRKIALSSEKSEEWGVPWLDLAKGKSISILKTYLEKALRDPASFIPDSLKGRITPADLKARLEALLKFYKTYGHFYVSNGPYILEKVDTIAKVVILKAFRTGYPLPPNYPEEVVARYGRFVLT